MIAIRRILVPIDFSYASRAALDYGARIALRMGAQLTALHVVPGAAFYDPLPAFVPPLSIPLDAERRRQLIEDLRRFVTAPASEWPRGAVVIRDGDPAREILSFADEDESDLIVLGTHGRSGLERWLLGSVTEQVSRNARSAVLAVPPFAQGTAIRRVICALDLTDSSTETLEEAGVFAKSAGAPLVALYVASGTHWYEPGKASGVDSRAMREAVAESARERIGTLTARLVPEGVRTATRITFGQPHHEIERIAGTPGDLIVMGVRRSSAVERLVFGSTARHVLRWGVCPTLLVRHAADGGSRGVEQSASATVAP